MIKTLGSTCAVHFFCLSSSTTTSPDWEIDYTPPPLNLLSNLESGRGVLTLPALVKYQAGIELELAGGKGYGNPSDIVSKLGYGLWSFL